MSIAESILGQIREVFPKADVSLVSNPSPSKQNSLRVGAADLLEIARWLRSQAEPAFDYLSNVTGVDWPEKTVKEKTKALREDEEGKTETTVEKKIPGVLEVVYHFYSVSLRKGPFILRVRTGDRRDQVIVPSLAGIWRSAELQEREVYDLYGVIFGGHPDLRRLLMWEGFEDFPMRKDYVEPDDYEYEPTPHGKVLEKSQAAAEPPMTQQSSMDGASNAEPSYIIRKQSKPEGEPGSEDLLEISMGPHHPSTHGVFQMNVALDGERVARLKPVFGYLHRNHEKIAESATYLSSMPYTDRLDYFNSMANNWAYALSVEMLAGIQVTERAEYIRVILAELTRLLNHTCLIGFLVMDMGALGTPLMYAFREREKILDLFESLSGSRMMCNYMRFGGCRCDLPEGWLQRAQKFIDEFAAFLDDYERLLTGNEILQARTQQVGLLSSELAVNAGVSGPMLRASGVNYDLRKVDAYGIYDQFDFRVPLGEVGDVYDRYMIRMLEMRESLKILQQALRQIPQGPVMNPKTKLRGFRPPAGEAYGRIEGPKGELGFYLISDGTPKPYRYRVRPPSLVNLTILEDMCLNHAVADVVVILGSIDIVLGEVDR